MTDDLGDFLRHLAANPKDPAAHAALADWLQDNPGRILDFVREVAPLVPWADFVKAMDRARTRSVSTPRWVSPFPGLPEGPSWHIGYGGG